MARIHNGRKGKSGSKKPHNQELPEWSLKDAKEIKSLVLELSEKGYSTAVIGTILRGSDRKKSGCLLAAVVVINVCNNNVVYLINYNSNNNINNNNELHYRHHDR